MPHHTHTQHTPLRTLLPTRSGMTIIELMITMLIVAGLFAGSLSLFGNLTRAELKSQSLRMSGMIKYTYGQAALRQQYYRMVFDLDSNAYWVEVATNDRPGQAPTIPQQEVIGAPDNATPSRRRRSKGYDKDDAEGSVFGLQRPSYQNVEDPTIKRRDLGNDIKIHTVFTPSNEDGVTSGRTSITFFPNGFVERCAIIISDGNNGFRTLEVEPLTGKVYILSGNQDPSNDFFDVEEAR